MGKRLDMGADALQLAASKLAMEEVNARFYTHMFRL
jgi:hypothetical protein